MQFLHFSNCSPKKLSSQRSICGRMQAGARNRGSVSSFGVAMAPSLALLCVILCCAPSLVLSSRHHGSSRASHCEGSSDLALTNDKIKRGPFSDVQQMERVQMLDGLFARITHHLKKSGIAFWAERDTLLSAYQHGSTFPYSQQLDLAIMSNFFTSAVAVLTLRLFYFVLITYCRKYL